MKDYRSKHLVDYERPDSISWTSLKVLDFLNGNPWDQVALNYIHSLRPSCIRVTKGETTLDSVPWRVTVYVDDYGIIRHVEQEVEVGCDGGFANAYELRMGLPKN